MLDIPPEILLLLMCRQIKQGWEWKWKTFKCGTLKSLCGCTSKHKRNTNEYPQNIYLLGVKYSSNVHAPLSMSLIKAVGSVDKLTWKENKRPQRLTDTHYCSSDLSWRNSSPHSQKPCSSVCKHSANIYTSPRPKWQMPHAAWTQELKITKKIFFKE